MSKFERNTIATDEDYFKLSSNVYDDIVLEKGKEIIGFWCRNSMEIAMNL
ncbi:hypothetical protein [Bacillus pseudomycoides]|nr:hypothetical protein [Bacillus pseudomycoides]